MKSSSDPLTSIKVVFVGAASSGKTSIINQMSSGSFDGEARPTVGAGLTVINNEHHVRVNIWDTAGQEKYRSLAKAYYHDAQVAVVVFDITSDESFHDCEYWFSELENVELPQHAIILVGNKTDLDDRQITKDEIEKYITGNVVSYIETSAKTGDGVKELSDEIMKYGLPLANKFVENPKEEEPNKKCCWILIHLVNSKF